MRIWDYKKQSCVTLLAHTGAIRALIQLDDYTIVSGSEDNTIKLWNLKNNVGDCLIATLVTHHADGIQSLLKLNDHAFIAGSHDGENYGNIQIWCLKEDGTWNCVDTIQEHEGEIISLMRLNDHSFVSGSDDKCMIIHEVDKDQLASVCKALVQEAECEASKTISNNN